jgi:hypothetical protein
MTIPKRLGEVMTEGKKLDQIRTIEEMDVVERKNSSFLFDLLISFLFIILLDFFSFLFCLIFVENSEELKKSKISSIVREGKEKVEKERRKKRRKENEEGRKEKKRR